MKTPKSVRMVTGFVATMGVISFIIGLAWSISTGFAGFWGGLPFWVIVLFVLCLAIYDFWEECVLGKK